MQHDYHGRSFASRSVPGRSPIHVDVPGKRTLSEAIAMVPVQAALTPAEVAATSAPSDAAAGAARGAMSDAGRPTIDVLFGGHLAHVSRAPSSGGSSLETGARTAMESAFGADFSAVRVHQDGRAETIGARAYTRGEDLHFAAGHYDPGSQSGRELIGHELAHVIQQRQGRVALPQSADGVINADPALEREADDLGRRAAAGEVVGRAAPPPSAAAAIQRAPIQRAVGFEFQTSWQLQHKVDDEWEAMGQADGEVFKDASGVLKSNPANVARNANANFVIEGDDGDVEFITPPFADKDRIKLAGVAMETFQEAVDASLDHGKALLSHVAKEFRTKIATKNDPRSTAQPNAKLVPATKVIDEADSYRIKQDDEDDGEARAQATVDAPLARFGEMMEGFDTTKAMLDDEESPDANFGAASVRARRALAGLAKDASWGRLHSLLALVLHYLWNPMQNFNAKAAKVEEDGYDNPGYPKSEVTVMLRNDFASLYSAMQGHEKAQFKVDWVLTVAGVDGDAPVFPRGFEDEGDGNIHFGPTRRAWIASIIDPGTGDAEAAEADKRVTELNPKLESPLNKVDLMSRGEVRASSAAMGAYKLKNELVIAEWRGLEPTDVAVSDWGALMEEALDRSVRNNPLPDASPLATDQRQRQTHRGADIPALQLTWLSGAEVDTVDEIIPFVEVYLDDQQRPLRLVDVKTEQRRVAPVAAGNAYGTAYRDEIAPNQRFVFELLTEADLDEIPASNREKARAKLRNVAQPQDNAVRRDGKAEEDDLAQPREDTDPGDPQGLQIMQEDETATGIEIAATENRDLGDNDNDLGNDLERDHRQHPAQNKRKRVTLWFTGAGLSQIVQSPAQLRAKQLVRYHGEKYIFDGSDDGFYYFTNM